LQTVPQAPLVESNRTVPIPFEPAEPFNPWGYWRILRRHLLFISLLFLVTEILTFAILITRPHLYTAVATILIDRQTPEILATKSQNQQTNPDSGETFYNTQYEILSSRSLAATVIHDLGLESNSHFVGVAGPPSKLEQFRAWLSSLLPAPSPNANFKARQQSELFGVKSRSIDLYESDLAIRPHLNTSVVSIAITTSDPALSAQMANAHIHAFIRQNYTENSRSGAEAEKFLLGKLDELEGRIEKSEAALNDYRRQRGVLAFSLDDKDQMVSDRMATLNRDLVEAEARRIALEADVATIKNSNAQSLPAVTNSSLIQRLREQAATLQGQYASLSNQFTPDYPPVAQLHAQLDEIHSQEQHEIAKIVDSLTTQYKVALAQEQDLRNDFEREKAQAMSLKDASLHDVVLSREVETNRALYQSVLERIKVLGVDRDSQVTNVLTIDPAEVPISPSSPKTKLSLVVSGFLALLVGVGVALVREATDSGLKSANEVEAFLRMPNLARIPHFNDPLKRRSLLERLTQRNPEPLTSGAGERALSTPDALVLAGEAYRSIRTGILLSRSETPPATILLSSAGAREGKTLTAVNTAIVFAQMMERVLLIDADLRRPRCHEIIGCNNGPGLTEVLTGFSSLQESVQKTRVKGLFFLSAGVAAPNPTELLSSKRMKEILSAAASSYQQVLIDCPPILPVSDSILLSIIVDGVVIVANGRTPRALVREACGRLMYVGSKILGVVLNDIELADHQPYDSYYMYGSNH
jgi:capsular exopolysaccharide synthesis family protein